VRNRIRSVNKRVIARAFSARHKGEKGEEKRKKNYRGLLRLTRQILNDAQRVAAEVEDLSRGEKRMLQPLTTALTEMASRVLQVVRQANARVFKGLTQLPGKIVSVFEPHTEIIRKGKASKPTEFGKLVKIQEAENQIITHYGVFDERPSDRELLLPAVEAHEEIFGRVPGLVAADAGFYSQAQERAAQDKGVKWVAVPNRSTRSVERKRLEKSRWFTKAQAWRTGCQGRISVLIYTPNLASSGSVVTSTLEPVSFTMTIDLVP
jgi:transposase, IS5 family